MYAATHTEISADARVGDAVRTVAAKLPQKLSFRCRDDTLSYEQLVTRADALAGLLAELDVRPGARVGIFMFKHVDMPVAVYGTLFAGATYVPLDPLTAPDRLAGILDDCGIDVLICDALTLRSVKKVAQGREIVVVAHDDVVAACLEDGIQARSWSGLTSRSSPSLKNREAASGAYLIYTSGSTGTPKGILHSHRSALAYVRACVAHWGFDGSEHFGNHSPLHFDMATMEFLVAPAIGATVTLVTEDVVKVPATMARLIQDGAINVWYSVPYALIQLMQAGAPEAGRLDGLKRIIFAGESFAISRLRELVQGVARVSFFKRVWSNRN